MALPKTLLSQGARLRRRATHLAINARDRFLQPESISLAGQSAFDVIHDNGLVKLRHYRPLNEPCIQADGKTIEVSPHRYRVPVVIVPPLAVNMLIYDLFPERSLVRYLLAHGFDVYLIDWGKPGFRHTHYNLATYVCELMPEFLARIRSHCGHQELSLHGWSMGGVISLCYAAVSGDANIRNLVVLGSPIDSHASGQLGKVYQGISRFAETVRKHTGFRIHNVNPRLLHTPGWANAVGFKLTDPVGSVKGYWELLRNLGDREFVINHATNAAFLDNMVAYPGGIMQDMMVRIWIDNELADGRMNIGGQEARLANINSSLLAFAGKGDNMVTPDAMSRLLPLVSGTDKAFHVVPGGHMGILSGSHAPATAWPITTEWLAARSD